MGIAVVVLVGTVVIDLISKWFTDEKQIWLTLGISFIVGIILGIVLLKCIDFTFFVVGAALGYVVGVFIYELIMLYVTWNAQIVYWVTLGIFIVDFGLLGLWVEKMVTIVATSFIGAYATIRGISLLAGGFPDVAKIFDLIEQQEWE